MQTRSPSRTARTELDQIIDVRAVDALYQPIVDLSTAEPVGYEALARGPVGSRYESPKALFAEAYRIGRAAELDWVCRAAAIRGALGAGLPRGVPLFVNLEPASLNTDCPPDLRPYADRAGDLRLVVELTERSLAGDPAGLLAGVHRARGGSVAVALDDVGAEPSSLAMMPLLGPDVIKLDLRLIQSRTDREMARIVNAVLAEAERTGAVILGEGIETPRHAAVARSMGATLGQGWYYGRPGPLPTRFARPTHGVNPAPASTGTARTPYEAVAPHRTPRLVAKELLLPMAMLLEYKGLDSAEPGVLLSAFQHARFFGDRTRARYARLAERGIFTAALGLGMPPHPGAGIRGGQITADDPLTGEWAVVALGPHFEGALVAKDCGDDVPEGQRRFEVVITHDRRLVIEAARSLMARLAPARGVTRPGPA